MAEPVTVDLLRHGEVAGAVSVARGCRTEVPLTETGIAQMQAVADALRDAPLAMIASSPLTRCRGFAEQLAAARRVPLAVHDGWREIDFGDWEGKGLEEIGDNAAVHAFLNDPTSASPPGGEDFSAFTDRVLANWNDWTQGLRGHALLVSHALVMRVILAHILGMPLTHIWRLPLPYAAWCRVSLLSGEQPRLLWMR